MHWQSENIECVHTQAFVRVGEERIGVAIGNTPRGLAQWRCAEAAWQLAHCVPPYKAFILALQSCKYFAVDSHYCFPSAAYMP